VERVGTPSVEERACRTRPGGAAFVEKVWGTMRRLTNMRIVQVGGLVVDLAEAPPVMGPKTQAFMADMYSVWAPCRRRCAVVVSDHPIQLLQHERLSAPHNPMFFARFYAMDEAIRWIRRGIGRLVSSGSGFEKIDPSSIYHKES